MKKIIALVIALLVIAGIVFGIVKFIGHFNSNNGLEYSKSIQSYEDPTETLPETTEELIQQTEEPTSGSTVADTSAESKQKQLDMLKVPTDPTQTLEELTVALYNAIGDSSKADTLLGIVSKVTDVIRTQKGDMMSSGLIKQTEEYFRYTYNNTSGEVNVISLKDEKFDEMVIFTCSIDGSYVSYSNIYQELVLKAKKDAVDYGVGKAEDDFRSGFPSVEKKTEATTEEVTTTAQPTTTFAYETGGISLTESSISPIETSPVETTTQVYTTEAPTTSAAPQEKPADGPHVFVNEEPSKAYDTLVFINAVTSTSTKYNTWSSKFNESEITQARSLSSKYMQKIYDEVVISNSNIRPENIFEAELDESSNTLVIKANYNNFKEIVCVLNANATVTDNSDSWITNYKNK